jgi:hypothetical protein
MTVLLEGLWGQSDQEKAMVVLRRLCSELLDKNHPPEMVSDTAVLWLLEIHTPSLEPPLSKLGRSYFQRPHGEA